MNVHSRHYHQSRDHHPPLLSMIPMTPDQIAHHPPSSHLSHQQEENSPAKLHGKSDMNVIANVVSVVNAVSSARLSMSWSRSARGQDKTRRRRRWVRDTSMAHLAKTVQPAEVVVFTGRQCTLERARLSTRNSLEAAHQSTRRWRNPRQRLQSLLKLLCPRCHHGFHLRQKSSRALFSARASQALCCQHSAMIATPGRAVSRARSLEPARLLPSSSKPPHHYTPARLSVGTPRLTMTGSRVPPWRQHESRRLLTNDSLGLHLPSQKGCRIRPGSRITLGVAKVT